MHANTCCDAGTTIFPHSTGGAGAADMALMRLAAATALLRLARMHDPRIHPEVYLLLALTLQAR